ncbi:hypothetical protein CJD44_35055, partial [Streptomyces sp. alain-838]
MTRTPATATPDAPVQTPAPSLWEELVTAALLGTDRRTPRGCEPGPRAPAAGEDQDLGAAGSQLTTAPREEAPN